VLDLVDAEATNSTAASEAATTSLEGTSLFTFMPGIPVWSLLSVFLLIHLVVLSGLVAGNYCGRITTW